MLQNTIVYLLGFPGTGKYTIAQEITRRAGFRLVDNHLINNPIFSIINADGKTKLPPRVWDNTLKVWEAVADTLVHISPPEYSFVLTNWLQEGDEGDQRHFGRIKSVAEQRRARFVPVRLMISDVEEHMRRITSPDRRLRMKETNPEAPPRYAASKGVLKLDHPHTLTLDVTHLKPDAAAEHILKHAAKI